MPNEAAIETRVIRNREKILGIGDSLYIRRCRMGPDYGVADLVFLPQGGKHKLVIVEAKQASSADAKIKVVGQLLMYYAGALELGLAGVRLLKDYAAANQNTRTAGIVRRSGQSRVEPPLLRRAGPLFGKGGVSAPTTFGLSPRWTRIPEWC